MYGPLKAAYAASPVARSPWRTKLSKITNLGLDRRKMTSVSETVRLCELELCQRFWWEMSRTRRINGACMDLSKPHMLLHLLRDLHGEQNCQRSPTLGWTVGK